MLKTEFEQYDTTFIKELESAMKQQYYRFQQIAVNMYSPQPSYSAKNNYNHSRTYHHSYYHKKRR